MQKVSWTRMDGPFSFFLDSPGCRARERRGAERNAGSLSVSEREELIPARGIAPHRAATHGTRKSAGSPASLLIRLAMLITGRAEFN